MGFKTGAGIIFGNSGGVSEAVLRCAGAKLNNKKINKANEEFSDTTDIADTTDITKLRGFKGIKTLEINSPAGKLKLAAVQGLKNAALLMESIKNKSQYFDLIEVMACPGGCIGGAGQPIDSEGSARKQRAHGLYRADSFMQLHKSQENPYVEKLYSSLLGKKNKGRAHELLHTNYASRKRLFESEVNIINSESAAITVKVCLGTGCFLRQSSKLLDNITENIKILANGNLINVTGTFCLENCGKGPNVLINDILIEKADIQKVMLEINRQLKGA
jgi:NADH-quinone oxidoreductase subunit G